MAIYTEIKAADIIPPHEVQDEAKLAALVESMRAKGWQGRELLIYDGIHGTQSLTGSHRLAAASQLDLTVQCYLIEDDELTEDQWADLDQACDDEDRLAILVAAFGHDDDATTLMAQEVDSNNAR